MADHRRHASDLQAGFAGRCHTTAGHAPTIQKLPRALEPTKGPRESSNAAGAGCQPRRVVVQLTRAGGHSEYERHGVRVLGAFFGDAGAAAEAVLGPAWCTGLRDAMGARGHQGASAEYPARLRADTPSDVRVPPARARGARDAFIMYPSRTAFRRRRALRQVSCSGDGPVGSAALGQELQ